MKKLVILSVIAPAMLGLSACGGGTDVGNVTTNDVVANVEDANLSVDENVTVLNDTVPADNVANAN